MNRNQNYQSEYKQEMVELYLSRNTSITKFREEEGLKEEIRNKTKRILHNVGSFFVAVKLSTIYIQLN